MQKDFNQMSKSIIEVDSSNKCGNLELWRHSLGQGGINNLPLPKRVVDGVKRLNPRLIRVFIQEYFNVYPEHGVFDWSKLDLYMEALEATGAKVVASINLKPKVLFPVKDERIWKPSDVEEWQRLIYELVKRYSVDMPLVTHWEIGNETDFGEHGGAPYLIQDAVSYAEFYKMTVKPVLEAFPTAKVGGPGATEWSVYKPKESENIGDQVWEALKVLPDTELVPEILKYFHENNIRLDFVSWHYYSDDLKHNAIRVERVKSIISEFPVDLRPEMMITEWNKDFGNESVEELAFSARRATVTAALLLSMVETGVDLSFYYHIWDQVYYPEQSKDMYSEEIGKLIYWHWNQMPHRFGLFGVDGEVRPQYFVYKMLNLMGKERVGVSSEDPDLRLLAASSEGKDTLLVANYNIKESQEKLLTVKFSNLKPGIKILKVYRIDEQRKWCEDSLELIPVEKREVYTMSDYLCQVFCPVDSVMLIVIEHLI